MKFADAPLDVQAELTIMRHNMQVPPSRQRGTTARHPDNGELWWPEPQCAVCGTDGHVNDHCHVTGLMRGRLCRSCNSAEYLSHRGPVFPFWRLHAPDLALENRTFYYSNWSGWAEPEFLTVEEVMTLPMADLLALSGERFTAAMRASAKPAADIMGRILDRGERAS